MPCIDAGLGRLVHAAGLVDLGDQRQHLALHLIGERLDIIGAAERIDHVAEMRLLAQDVLGRDRDARRLLGRRGDRFVVGVGVQRLQSAHDAGHRLHGDAGDVVERLLLGEIDARRLAVEFEAPGARILGAQPLARQPRPDAPAGAEFGDLLEEADGNVEEEGEAAQHDDRCPCRARCSLARIAAPSRS